MTRFACLIFVLLISACGKIGLEPKHEAVVNYDYQLIKVDYSRLFKNRDRLFNSHLNTPADSNGVFLFEYNGNRYYHPVALCFRSLEALCDYSKTADLLYLNHAIKSMEALRAQATRHQDMLYFPYDFDYDTVGNTTYIAPWYSGMAQGLALAAYSRLYYFTSDDHYTAIADSILRTMTDFDSEYSTVQNYQNDELFGVGSYYWVDEYPDGPRRYVLNGSIIGAMGLYDHWWVYGDDLSRELFSAEISTVRDKVLKYRNPGDISAYCLLFRRKQGNYHVVHYQLLQKLQEFSGDAYFGKIADLFISDHR
ncbi:MAG: D-glucuronyl C5-epimerase family protein [Candidatus Cloacimonetes bacterium]|nr:D-glucuronyl C5-epimerase family protein [Candidatus Cloacimonadota bacterium]